MNRAIIYSPFLDWTILKELKEYSAKYSRSTSFSSRGKTKLHEIILALSSSDYKKVPKISGPFKEDSVIGDYHAGNLFKEFIERNKFSLEIPIPPKPTNFTIFLSSAAIMSLITEWPAEYKAEKRNYEIKKEDSFSGESINVKGFILSDVKIGTIDGEEVSAIVNLGNGFRLEFFDLTAFKNEENFFRDDAIGLHSIMSLENKEIFYFSRNGYLYCPSIDVNYHVTDHLAGVKLENENFKGGNNLKEIIIDSSELLGKLELSEWGIKAKVEVVATSRMVFTARLNHSNQPPVLTIRSGLVTKIYYEDSLLYIAYVPQELFKKL